jgi:hypothetical protein
VSRLIARRARTRRAAIIAASLAGHALFFAMLGLTGPGLRQVRRVGPEPVMIEFWTPPPADRARRRGRALTPPPSPITPRRRASNAPPADIEPLPMRPGPAGPAAASGMAAGDHPAPLPGAARGDLRTVLRGSAVGCANRDAVGLTRREREACDEAWGGRAVETADVAAPIDPAQRAEWDAVAARKTRDRRWREAPMPPGLEPSSKPGFPAGLGR